MGFFSRLPSYSLPFALGLMEYLVRFFQAQNNPVDFLPAALVTASLGLLVTVVVNDVNVTAIVALPTGKQDALKAASAFSAVLLMFGIPVWMLVLYETVSTLRSPMLNWLDAFGVGRNLTLGATYYILALLSNEIKVMASK